MKKIIIAASLVGAAAAAGGVILYLRNRNKPSNQIADAAENAKNVMNRNIGKVERKTNAALS